MRLFDSIKHAFNPEVKNTFDYLYKNYYKGLELFCTGTGVDMNYGGYHIHTSRINLSDPSYHDMKRIYESKDSIIKYHEFILQMEQVDADKKDLKNLQSRYPHAFVYYCNQCLGGVIYDASIKMPGEMESNRQQNQNSQNILSFNLNTFFNDTQKCYYGEQYGPIPYNRGDFISKKYRYQTEPKSIDDLIYADIKVILSNKHMFAKKEEEIINVLNDETIKINFDHNILNNKRRFKYYKKFLLFKRHDDKDTKYLIEHINELDQFIVQYINEQYDTIKMKYRLGVMEYTQNKYFGESDLDVKERTINNEDEVRELNEAKKKYLQLKVKYPKGLSAFEKYNSYDDGKNSAELSILEIVEREDDIARFEEYADENARYKSWEEEQNKFASETRSLSQQGMGCYYYDVEFPCIGPNGKKIERRYRVWQHFYNSYYQPSQSEKIPDKFYYLEKAATNNSRFLTKKCYYGDEVYDHMLNLILEHKNKFGDLLIIFGNNGLTGDEATSLNNFHFRYLENKLIENNIKYWNWSDNNYSELPSTRYIIIVEFISTNDNLCQFVKNIRLKFAELKPLISYISVRKGYDKAEVESIINKEKRKQQEIHEREEQRKKAEQEKKLAEERKRREIEEEYKRQQEAILKKRRKLQELQNCVSDWYTHTYNGSVKHKWFVDYYSYRDHKDFADSSMWDTWKFVWHFKNTPDSVVPTLYSEHNDALNRAVQLVEECLKQTFGNEVSKLTLVCLTASTREKNERRFKPFAEIVCRDLDMYNAYSHINITVEGEAKNMGGTGIVQKSYDKEWFKDKYVVLFDDVRTSGKSIESEKQILEAMGAHVICAITLAQTTN